MLAGQPGKLQSLKVSLHRAELRRRACAEVTRAVMASGSLQSYWRQEEMRSRWGLSDKAV